MKRVSKIILKILLWIIGVFITLDLLLVALIFVPPVQRKIIEKAASFMSEITGGEVTVDRIYLSPLLAVTAENLAIKDHKGNNMIFAATLKAKVNLSKTGKKRVCLSFAELEGADVIVRKYEGDESVNIAIWAKGFAKKERKQTTFVLFFENITLKNSRFAFVDDTKRRENVDNKIDYAFFELKNMELDVDDFQVLGADISCKINSLTFDQYTGFQIQKFSALFRINAECLTLDNLNFETPFSTFTGDFAFRYNGFKEYGDFLNKINFDTQIKSSALDLKDVIYFVPAMQGMENKIILTGHVGGVVNHLKLKDLYAKYKTHTFLSGDFELFDILDFKNSSYKLQFREANVNLAELQQFKLPKSKTIKLPNILSKLKSTRIKGSYRGTFTKFDTDLEIQSNLGAAKLVINTAKQKNFAEYNGFLKCQNIAVGDIVELPNYLNTISLQADFLGSAIVTENMNAFFDSFTVTISGKINDLDLSGKPLQDITFGGKYSKESINAEIRSKDSMLTFIAKGAIAFHEKNVSVNGSISKINIKVSELFSYFPKNKNNTKAIGFQKFIQKVHQNPNLVFTADSIAATNLSGFTFETLNGYLGIDNAMLTNGDKRSRLDHLRLTAINNPNFAHQYILRSNALNGKLKTNYNWEELTNTFQEVAHYYIPQIFDEPHFSPPEMEPQHANKYGFIDLSLQFFYSRNLLNLIANDYTISSNSSLKLHIAKDRADDFVNLSVPQFRHAKLGQINNLKLDGQMSPSQMLEIALVCDSISIFQGDDRLTFSEVKVGTESNSDGLAFEFQWKNPLGISINELNKINGTFRQAEKNNFVVKILDSKLWLRHSLWSFTGSGNSVTFGGKKIFFDNCLLVADQGKISIDGEISRLTNKPCQIALENFDISLLNSITARLGISFAGDLSMKATINTDPEHFSILGKTYISKFVFNEELLGDLVLLAEMSDDGDPRFGGGLLTTTDTLSMNLEKLTYSNYLRSPHKIADIKGSFNTKDKELRVKATMDTLKIGFLSPFLSSFSNAISGAATGELLFVLNADSLYFDGKINVQKAQLGIAPLNTLYHINNQEIIFNNKGIEFPNLLLTDKYNNEAILSGYVYHTKFKNFNINLKINTDRILAINTPKKADSPFFGTGFVSGGVSILGDTKQLIFSSQNLKTLTGSQITFPMSSATTVSSTDGIYFVKASQTNTFNEQMLRKTGATMIFDFTFNITRDADVRLELDPIDGLLQCKTNGKLQLNYNSANSELNLDGNLSVVSGKFGMSLRNFIPREFTIVEGGTISFTGPLTSSQLNIKAMYEKTCSIETLGSNLGVGRTDVNAIIGLNGNLMNPGLNFEFAFPKLTNEEQFKVFAALDTMNHQNALRQFFSFVFLNTFITPESAANAGQQTFGAGIDLVTNMVNSFLSSQISRFDLGFNFINNQQNYREYSVNAAIPFYNDRFVVKTNLGYGESLGGSSKNNFVGDVSFEAKLNEAGNLRFKAFYFSDKVDINSDPSKPQQGGGIGISFQQEFNNKKDFSEGWVVKKKEKKKK